MYATGSVRAKARKKYVQDAITREMLGGDPKFAQQLFYEMRHLATLNPAGHAWVKLCGNNPRICTANQLDFIRQVTWLSHPRVARYFAELHRQKTQRKKPRVRFFLI